MELFTKIDIPLSDFKIDYHSKLAFIGSCFATNISKKFEEVKFETFTNPLGTVYNPLSISTMIKQIVQEKIFTENDIFFDSKTKLYHSYFAHGDFSNANQNECLNNLNSAIKKSKEYFSQADFIFITLGTAFVYFLKASNHEVFNCHKQNPDLFFRQLISVEDAAIHLSEIVNNLLKINKNLKIIFTVSPLRHLSDGAHNNNLSKATLLLAINKMLSNFNSENLKNQIQYFPSFEITMDELRDYRFYKSDMIHLSDIAEQYVFEKLTTSFMTPKTIENINRIQKFLKNVTHKIENTQSNETYLFAQKCINQISTLTKEIPDINLNKELSYFKVIKDSAESQKF